MSKRQLEESRAAKATLFFSPCTKPQDNKLSITILCKPSLWKILNRCHSDFIKVCVLEGASFSKHLKIRQKALQHTFTATWKCYQSTQAM